MTVVLCVGHAVQDFVFTLDTLPTRAEKHAASSLKSVGGGPAASAAVAIARLGAKAILVSRLGQDTIGDLILDDLSSSGVDTRFIRRFENCQSSLSAVMVNQEGERMIVNYLDPALPEDAGWLDGMLPQKVDAVLADSRWPQAAVSLLAQAKEACLPAVLDADQLGRLDRKTLGAATHAAFSAEGLAEFAGHRVFDRALSELSAELGIWCCVTLGKDGVMYTEKGRVEQFPSFAVEAIDTLGAGDIWHGCFACALAEGQPAPDAIRFASAAAAIKVTRSGGRSGAPTRDEVEHFLLHH
ncbi:MAG: PfkB family carbohydrate kinase [Xanthomonadales bacterium]|nr:PfkB family carbohydrate kinase [Xanthomonadales bacterium]